MKNEKMLMALTDNDIEFLPQTTKQKILNTVMPVLLPQKAVPQGRVKLPVRGMDDIMLTFVFCSDEKGGKWCENAAQTLPIAIYRYPG